MSNYSSSRNVLHVVCDNSVHLNDNTTLDEVIKGNGTTSRSVEFPHQHVIESVRQSVAKAGKSYVRGRKQVYAQLLHVA